MSHAAVQPGCSIDDIDTPALCLDLDRLEENIAAVADECRAAGVAWRPHSKGHKSPQIAALELAAGALGITCAKLGEAEVMAAAGVRDILIANVIVGRQKLARLAALRRVADPIVCVDDRAQIDPLAEAFREQPHPLRVLIEVDIGLKRVGVPPGAAAVALARRIHESRGLALAGLMGYEGHLLTVADPEEKAASIQRSLDELAATRERLVQAGLPCDIVSCGGTGSLRYAIQHEGITEVQAGGAVFMDAYYRHTCQVAGLDYALLVAATVVSRPTPERAVIDAGRKTMNIELHAPLAFGRAGVRVKALNAEHGVLELDDSARDVQVGDRLYFVPGYCDLTTMLHDQYYVFRSGKLVDTWPIAARGRLQ